VVDRPRLHLAGSRLAHRVLHRAGAGPDHHLPAPAHSGEPPVVADPWQGRRGEPDGRRDRGPGQGGRARARRCAGEQGRLGGRETTGSVQTADRHLSSRCIRSAPFWASP
jgi:hypothetical protein